MVARGPRRLVPLATILVVGMTSCVAAGDEPTGVAAPPATPVTTPTVTSPAAVPTGDSSPAVPPGPSPMGSPSASGAATGSPSVTAPPRPPKRPPKRWAGVQVDPVNIEVMLRGRGTAPTRILRWSATDEGGESSPSYVSDIAFAPSEEAVFAARCCEPVPGTIYRVDLASDGKKPEPFDQGDRVDASGAAVGRIDPRGDVGVRPSSTPRERGKLVPLVGAIDLTLEPGGHRVAALLDESWTNECCFDSAPPAPPGVLLLDQQQDGRWRQGRSWPLPRRYCAAVWLHPGKVALLHGHRRGPCTGARLDLFNPYNGKLEKDAVRLPRAAQHVGVDDSGTYLIYTEAGSGGVHWLTLDGRRGQLAEDGFTMADW